MSTDTSDAASTRVRFAERCDYDQVLFLCRELHEENGLFEMSDEKIAHVIDNHFNRSGGIIGVIGARAHWRALSSCSLAACGTRIRPCWKS